VVFDDGTYPVVIHKRVGSGQIALIGFDYFDTNADTEQILGNAVNLWYYPRRPAILAYVEYTDYDEEYANTLAAIDTTFGTTYVLRELWNDTQLDLLLPDMDILLIPEQEATGLSTMETIGAAWTTSLSTFMADGGIIIVCDFNWGGGGTYGILTGAGLMSIAGANDISPSTVYLVDPADPLAEGVSNTLSAPNGALHFVTTETNVVFDDGTNPVVIHKTVGSGQIALIGFDYYTSNADTERILGNAVDLRPPEIPPAAYLVVRGTDDRIYYRVWTGSGSGWSKFPGKTPDAVAAEVLGSDLHIVVRGMTGGIYHGSLDLITDVWSGWTKISGETPSAPELAASATELYLVVRGTDDRIYYRTWTGSWSGWSKLPGKTTDSPAAHVLGNDLHVVVKGSTGGIYHGRLDLPTTSWSGWSKISGNTPSAPELAASATELYLVVRGTDDRIYYRSWAGSWTGWSKFTGKTPDSPAAHVLGKDLHVVVRGSTGGIYHGTLDLLTTSWSGWSKISGNTPSAPELAG
jgi:hypothetical protein